MNNLILEEKNYIVRIFVISLILVLSGSLYAQSPYELDFKKEVGLLGLGVGAYTAGLIYEKQITPLSREQILRLEDEFLDIDEWAVDQYSSSARLGSDIGLGLGNLAPTILFLSGNTKGDRAKIGIMYLETMGLTLAVTGWTKRLVLRPRPFNYNPNVDLSEKLTKNARFSFFSGHTSTTAAACFFTAAVWSQYHKDSKWRIPVWTVAATIPAVTGFLRANAGKHFPSDVISGYAMGAGVGLLVPWLHRSRIMSSDKFEVSIGPNLIYCKVVF